MRFSLVHAAVAASLALGVATAAKAGVNVNNGNFYIAYTDLYLTTSGLNIDLTRTYNSRSNYVKGYFGIGWSSEIEGYLTFEKDAINYVEGGGGNIVRFKSSGKNTWANGVFGPQTLKKSSDGYQLLTTSGKELLFNDKGQLQRIQDKNKNYLQLVWEQGHPTVLKDNQNNQVRITWGDYGKTPRIKKLEVGAAKAYYNYSALGDLTEATGADGIRYQYSYDDEHNMTKISYKDGKYKEMQYNKTRDWITRFRDTNKLVTTYDYLADSLDPESKFGTIVTRFMEGSKTRDESRYWYEFRRRADGSRYNYKTVTLIKNMATETIFTECCGTPMVISQWKSDAPRGRDNQKWTLAKGNKRSTFFEYYPDGLLKKKSTSDGRFTLLTYDPVHKKVASVARNDRKVEYHYDGRGNLAWAFDNAEHRRLDLTYDVKGRLTMVSEARQVASKKQSKEVYFRYDTAGRPIEVKQKTAAGEGVIRLSYDSNGEVSGIMNGKGRSVSSENEMATAQGVATTFQDLIEIVQPAGVSLTPEA